MKAAVNLFFLVLAIAFSMLWLLWLYQGNVVNDVGSWMTSSYTDRFASEKTEILSRLGERDITAAVELLENKKWRKIRLLDRAFPMKRQILQALSYQLHRAKRYEELLHWSGIWIAEDERNVKAMAYWYDALRHSPDRHDEGVQGLRREWERFPANKLLTSFNLMMSYEEQGYKSLRTTVETLKDFDWFRSSTQGWELHWQWKIRHVITSYTYHQKQRLTDGKWGELWNVPLELWRILLDWKNTEQLKEKGYLQFSVFPDLDDRIHIRAEIPRNMSTIRIDLPPHIMMRISEFGLTIDGESKHIAPDNFDYMNLLEKEGSIEVVSSKARWGKSHWEDFGKAEGRTLSGDFVDYVNNHPDLLLTYQEFYTNASDPFFRVNLLGVDKADESPLMVVDISFQVTLLGDSGEEILLSNRLVTDPRFNKGSSEQ